MIRLCIEWTLLVHVIVEAVEAIPELTTLQALQLVIRKGFESRHMLMTLLVRQMVVPNLLAFPVEMVPSMVTKAVVQ